MKHCPACKMDIRGEHIKCPLCHSKLTESEHAEDCDCGNIFPAVPTVFEQYKLIIKIALFLSISAAVIAVAVNMMVPHNRMWSLFVMLGIGCVLVSFVTALRKRKNIVKTMYNQVIMISVFAVLWDFLIGWRGWSIDFVIPILLGFNIIFMFVTAQILKLKIEDYMFYLMISSVGGLIPLVFLTFDIAKIVYPSYISVILGVISLAALVVFYSNKIISEMKKRFHM